MVNRIECAYSQRGKIIEEGEFKDKTKTKQKLIISPNNAELLIYRRIFTMHKTIYWHFSADLK